MLEQPLPKLLSFKAQMFFSSFIFYSSFFLTFRLWRSSFYRPTCFLGWKEKEKCEYVYLCVCVYVCVWVCVFVCVCIYVCVYVCVCLCSTPNSTFWAYTRNCFNPWATVTHLPFPPPSFRHMQSKHFFSMYFPNSLSLSLSLYFSLSLSFSLFSYLFACFDSISQWFASIDAKRA